MERPNTLMETLTLHKAKVYKIKTKNMKHNILFIMKIINYVLIMKKLS